MFKLFPLALALTFLNPTQPSALQEFKLLQQQQEAAKKAGDSGKVVTLALQVQALLNHAPDAILDTAESYAHAGDAKNALASLQLFADLGQVSEDIVRGQDKSFSAFQNDPRFQATLGRFAKNKTPVSRADTAFVLSDSGLLTEDIDYDLDSRSFLISSVIEKKIIRVTPDGKSADFAHSPSNWPVLALKIDASRHLVWATEVAMNDFVFAPKSDWGRSAVLCFDLHTGKLLRRIDGPPSTALGDMFLSTGGVPILSDGDGGGIYILRGDRMERIDTGDFISPQTAARHPDGKHIFVPDYARGIGVLDLSAGSVRWLNQSSPPKFALNGIDGLYFDRGWLIATQNGSSPERVIRFHLSNDLTNVVSEEIIERAAPALGDPAHGVVVGDDFYYIANSGWSKLDDHGTLKPGSKLTPARVMRFHL
jgi:sugar lactone lactonase YvrE